MALSWQERDHRTGGQHAPQPLEVWVIEAQMVFDGDVLRQ